jgi:hypothetical protein
MFKQRKPKKVKQIPDPPKPCKVIDKNGVGYDCDYGHEEATSHLILIGVYDRGYYEPAVFVSHARAHSVIHHTIEFWKSQNREWSKDDFRVEDTQS